MSTVAGPMTNWAERLRRSLGWRTRPPFPPCRLSQAQAFDIARPVLGAGTPLRVMDIAPTGDGAEWLIGTATVGSGRTVRINDADGAVIEQARWGVR